MEDYIFKRVSSKTVVEKVPNDNGLITSHAVKA